MKITALILFILLYVVLIGFPKYRAYGAWAVAVIYLVLGILTPSQLLLAPDINVLLMLAGTMLLVDYFIQSKMPGRLADFLLARSKNVMWVTIFMSLFAGIVSAFIDNVATVLMLAPVALAVCKRLSISPVPMLVAISVSSNLQGAATLVGDTTSIMLGAYARMDFLDFFVMRGRPGMFFAVELGALATIPIMMILFRDQKDPVTAGKPTEVSDYIPTAMLLLMVASLIGASFIKNKPSVTNGVLCMFFALVTTVLELVKNKKSDSAKSAVRAIDWETLFLLAGMFVVIEGITQAGIIDDMASIIMGLGGKSIFRLYTIIVWGSVIISAFVDNIPYVATMLPVIKMAATGLGADPALLYFGLLCGATLGGNITPVGASANITAVGMLRKNGYEVKTRDFCRIGIPFTLTAVVVGYLFIWIFWRA